MARQCDCIACLALAERYDGDRALLDHYRKRLLVRGWAGSKDPIEKAYILRHAKWAQAAAANGAQNIARSA